MLTADKFAEDKTEAHTFFDRPRVHLENLSIADGVPLGIEQVTNAALGVGGAYGAWGNAYDNESLLGFVEKRIGDSLRNEDRMELSSLGFICRHHIPDLSDEDHLALEIEIGVRMLRAAAEANNWQMNEVEGVLVGMSGPVADDYVVQIAERAGIPQNALKVSIHKACDGSVSALNLALNPGLARNRGLDANIAEELYGKKVLLGGIEGLSRFTSRSRDRNALQLFANGAGIIGVIPGKTVNFLVGKDHEAFDEQGVLAVRMYYPHNGGVEGSNSLIEVSQAGPRHIRVAGMMHEPDDDSPLSMAGPMGMVKLFVRTGVDVVRDVYEAYKQKMNELGTDDKSIAVAIVHHANYKINQLKGKHLKKAGIHLDMPWLLSDFGNVSAASNMIAFLRQLPMLKPGQHVLFDGFGAGTYYDVLAVEFNA